MCVSLWMMLHPENCQVLGSAFYKINLNIENFDVHQIFKVSSS